MLWTRASTSKNNKNVVQKCLHYTPTSNLAAENVHTSSVQVYSPFSPAQQDRCETGGCSRRRKLGSLEFLPDLTPVASAGRPRARPSQPRAIGRRNPRDETTSRSREINEKEPLAAARSNITALVSRERRERCTGLFLLVFQVFARRNRRLVLR